MGVLINVAEVNEETEDEKRDRRIDRGLAQHITRLRTEGRFSHAAAHRCSHAAVRFRLLREDNQDQEQRNDDEYKGGDADENAHLKG